ncbi:MAG: ComEC/Rec2 family competence protein [Chloroflexaceae bacterium]
MTTTTKPEPQTRTLPAWTRVLLPILLLSVALALAAWVARPDGYLRVIFLDTPGDAILIQTPHGGYVLVDGGSKPSQLTLNLGRRMPFWQRSLAAVILTQGDGERMPGQVAALARYRAELALTPPGVSESATAREWLRLLESQDTPIHPARGGERLDLDGILLTVLTAGDGAEAGMVLRLDYGATSVVIHGTTGTPIDEMLLPATAQPITALAYPWQREIDTPLLAAWQPQAIIFTSAYAANEPALHTYHERALNGAALYHEKLDGTVTLISDGRRAWIETEK